uniref:Uncharacterized protein n=1 Tax=Rhizophora mucronata TaxID=61149 RepID=A0A2P2P2Z5_RHIMU
MNSFTCMSVNLRSRSIKHGHLKYGRQHGNSINRVEGHHTLSYTT